MKTKGKKNKLGMYFPILVVGCNQNIGKIPSIIVSLLFIIAYFSRVVYPASFFSFFEKKNHQIHYPGVNRRKVRGRRQILDSAFSFFFLAKINRSLFPRYLWLMEIYLSMPKSIQWWRMFEKANHHQGLSNNNADGLCNRKDFALLSLLESDRRQLLRKE